MDKRKLAVSHATSLIGEAVLERLIATKFSAKDLVLLDDASKEGTKLPFAGTHIGCQNQDEFDLSTCSLLLMLEDNAELRQRAVSQGCFVISHTGDLASPGVFAGEGFADPEVSFADTSLRLVSAELACLLPVISALNSQAQITRVNCCLMHSVEFQGKAGVDELASQTIGLLNAREVKPQVFPDQIAFNLLTEASELSFRSDLASLLPLDANSVYQQSVSIPVFHGFAAAIQLEFDSEMDLAALRKQISKIPNVEIKDKTSSPITDCKQSFSCVISQCEQADSQRSSLQFWLIADPLRYGMAMNYVSVTEFLLKSFL